MQSGSSGSGESMMETMGGNYGRGDGKRSVEKCSSSPGAKSGQRKNASKET